MSERISIVVPDGTRTRLKKQADSQKRKQSNLGMKYILDGLSKDENLPVLKVSDSNGGWI